jgi:hypothetical protein
MVAGVEVTAAGLGGSDRRCGEAEKKKKTCNDSHGNSPGGATERPHQGYQTVIRSNDYLRT